LARATTVRSPAKRVRFVVMVGRWRSTILAVWK